MTDTPSGLVCGGCGGSPPPGDPYPFRCPNQGSGSADVDHVLTRVLDLARVEFPPTAAPAESEPFIRYRGLLHSHHRAIAGGLSDEWYVERVTQLDDLVAGVDGHGFAATPYRRSELLSSRLGFDASGGVWVKDETGNVAGSHKARHLMGVLLHLEVAEDLGLADPSNRPDLAIASCGNAALAAGVLAAAADRHLKVLVPVDADTTIVGRLVDLGADVIVCPREPGVTGDPTYARLLRELDGGALPFTVQGNLNGLAIEGGETLGYEIVSDLAATGVRLEHLVVQVGGGALASSTAQSFAESVALGVLDAMPRVHTVQTMGAHPLERAYHKVLAALPADPGPEEIHRELRHAATRRSKYMWPWESEPKSVATGILDDETYDWLAVVEGMLSSGGRPLVVSEDRLAEAHELGRADGYDVSATGAAGLAGLLDLRSAGAVRADERVALLFTGSKG